MDTNTQIIIENVIKSFIENEEPFTALDITNEVNKQVKVFHFDCSEFVRNYMKSVNDYMITIITVDVKIKQAHARLYHHNSYNPDNYVARNQTVTYFTGEPGVVKLSNYSPSNACGEPVKIVFFSDEASDNSDDSDDLMARIMKQAEKKKKEFFG